MKVNVSLLKPALSPTPNQRLKKGGVKGYREF